MNSKEARGGATQKKILNKKVDCERGITLKHQIRICNRWVVLFGENRVL